MGLRTRAILLGVATYLASPLGLALGLGEIKVNSHLNQPLEAEIQLLQTRELTAQEILVGLGSSEDFERVGVERPFFLNDLKFTVDMNSPNGPVILIKSNRLVKEPFLNFIVQAQWPSGKLLREYTVLMDLPVFTNQPARAVKAAEAKPSIAQQAQTQRQPAQPVRRSAPATQSRGFDGDTYGPVSSTDTLWSIASKAKPGDDVTVQQTMLAIQRLNPDAFINNNINLLKRGAVLRLPTEADITEFDPRQAKREVASQNRSAQLPAAQIDATRSTVERAPAADKVQGRVKLTSASDITGSKSGSGSGEGEQDADALRTQLLSTQEELASTKRENEDLNARVQSMDEQVKTMEKLLEVANADLRKLELALAEQQRLEAEAEAANGEVEPADDTATAETAIEATTEVPTDVTETPVDSQPVEAQPAVEPETKPVEPVAKPVEPVAPPAAEKKSIVDMLMDYIYFIGGGLVLLIGGLVYFLLTRKDSFDDDDFDYDEDHMPEEDPIAAASDDTVLDDGRDFAVAGFDAPQAPEEQEPEITLDSLGSDLLNDSGAQADDDRTVLAEDAYGKRSDEYDELDTTLQFDAISEADLDTAGSSSALDLDEDHTVLDLPETEHTQLDTGFSAQDDLGDLDADLELDLDVELDESELSLDDFDDSFEASEESLTAEVDFGELSSEEPEDEPAELSLDLEENALALDLEDDNDKDEFSLDIDLDEEITSSRGVEDGDDELDLTNLVVPSQTDGDDLDLSVGEDLSLGDDFELGDDLELDEDLSLDSPSKSDTQSFDISELEALDETLEDAPETAAVATTEALDDLDDELDKLASDFEGDLADLDDDFADLDETIAESSLETSAPVVEPEALTDVAETEPAASDDEGQTLLPDFDPDSDDDSEPSFLGDSDEVATKIDLLRVFVDMGDTESALNTLEEIREEGTDAQKKEAEELFAELG